MSALDSPSSMRVSASTDLLGRWVGNRPQFWIKMGNLETKLLAMDLEDVAIRAPVYVCGLPRSGSTLLLEILASHSEAVTHRYQDFPFVFTPYWWNGVLSLNPLRSTARVERAHGDKMLVNAQSPEAMEEMLWMAFFPKLHIPDHTHVLDAATTNPAFAAFYRDHIRKLLLARKGKRYVSKGNYNIVRMAYLRSLFPEARFIVPVRDPVTHVESLMRQHARFRDAGRNDPHIVTHMSLAGHMEFGLNRSLIHTGDPGRVHDIQTAWARGDEVRGWALYWNMLYRFVHDQLKSLPELAGAVQIVRFETLCDAPRETIPKLLAHAGLHDDGLAGRWAPSIHRPDYYTPSLTADDIVVIRDITATTAKLFGY